MNYSIQQPRSNQISSSLYRQQRGNTNHRNSHEATNHRHFYSINNQRISRGGGHSRSIQQHDEQRKKKRILILGILIILIMMELHLNYDLKIFQVFLLINNNRVNFHHNQLRPQRQS